MVLFVYKSITQSIAGLKVASHVLIIYKQNVTIIDLANSSEIEFSTSFDLEGNIGTLDVHFNKDQFTRQRLQLRQNFFSCEHPHCYPPSPFRDEFVVTVKPCDNSHRVQCKPLLVSIAVVVDLCE